MCDIYTYIYEVLENFKNKFAATNKALQPHIRTLQCFSYILNGVRLEKFAKLFKLYLISSATFGGTTAGFINLGDQFQL